MARASGSMGALAVAVVALVVCIFSWRALAREAPASTAVETVHSSPGRGRAAEEVALSTPRDEPGAARRAADDPVPPADVDPERPRERRATAVLDVLVYDEARRDGLEGAQLTLRLTGEAAGGSRYRLAGPYTTDANGAASIAIWAGVTHELRVINVFGGQGEAEVRVPPVPPGEHHELRVPLDAGYRDHFRGAVVDATTGAPIASAIVRVRDHLARQDPFSNVLATAPYLELGVDPTGAVGFWYDAYVDVSVRAPDHVECHFRASRRRLGGAAFEVRLWPAAATAVTVTDLAGEPFGRVRVRLVLYGEEAGPVDESRGVRVETAGEWRGLTDAEGRCHVEGLPAATRLAIELSRSGVPLRGDVGSVVLDAGETRALSLVAGD